MTMFLTNKSVIYITVQQNLQISVTLQFGYVTMRKSNRQNLCTNLRLMNLLVLIIDTLLLQKKIIHMKSYE